MRRFRRLDRTAVEIDEIGDLPLRSPYRRLHQSKAEGKSFRLIYRMARGVTFDLSLALWPRRPSSKVKKAPNGPRITHLSQTPLWKRVDETLQTELRSRTTIQLERGRAELQFGILNAYFGSSEAYQR